MFKIFKTDVCIYKKSQAHQNSHFMTQLGMCISNGRYSSALHSLYYEMFH